MATQKSEKKSTGKSSKKAKKNSPKKHPEALSVLFKDVKAIVKKHRALIAFSVIPSPIHCGPGERPVTITHMVDGEEVTETICVPI
jgi:hypothetical protein